MTTSSGFTALIADLVSGVDVSNLGLTDVAHAAGVANGLVGVCCTLGAFLEVRAAVAVLGSAATICTSFNTFWLV
jgi:hypothetical protein